MDSYCPHDVRNLSENRKVSRLTVFGSVLNQIRNQYWPAAGETAAGTRGYLGGMSVERSFGKSCPTRV